MTKEPKHVTLTLTEEQASHLLAPAGEGGHQQLHEMLRHQLAGGNLTVDLNDEELGRIVRYMTQYGSGGFQGRLKKALADPLVRLLAGHGIFPTV
jgi:hypothetical protein